MLSVWITSSLQSVKAPTNIALGNFDGVHLGHRQVMAQIFGCPAAAPVQSTLTAQSIATLHGDIIASGSSHWPAQPPAMLRTELQEAELLSPKNSLARVRPEVVGAVGSRPLATVVTFSPHPREYFSGVSRSLLTPIAEKTWQLSQLGIEQLVLLPFNQALAELSPQEFVEQILIKGLGARQISVGSDFRFGKGRSGDADGLRAIAAHHNIPVTQVALKYDEQGDRISSSRIRAALDTGHPDTAAQLLGRPYTLTGKVVKGKQLGRTIGFPTANLQVPNNKYLPRTGVYGVRVYGDQASEGDSPNNGQKGVMNIGNRPTVDGQSLSIEVHLLDWSGDLYDQILTVSLESFIRSEQKFESLDRLKAQIATDCEHVHLSLT
ncbi:MAG: bifunctional riboflavin kinase/FAD synthetase [Cyanobacteria bacterium P01_D01_bin.1]